MVEASVAFAGTAIAPGIIAWLLLTLLRVRAPLIAVLATHYAMYLLCAGLVFRLLHQPHLRCAGAILLAMIVTVAIWLNLRRVAVALNQRCDIWQTIAILVIAIAAVLPSAYIYVHQGFFPDNGQTLFAPGIFNDQLRNANLIAALAENRQSVYFPNSELIYQITWHHAVANATALLQSPEFSWLPRSLGASLVTGALCYASMLWLIVVLRAQHLSLCGLFFVSALALSEADIAGALSTFVEAGHLGIAADGTSLLGSPYRYFSVALITITAPTHASFFIVCSLSAALLYRSSLVGMSDPLETAVIPGLIFVSVAGVVDPILFVVAAVPIGGAVLLLSSSDPSKILRVCGCGAGVVGGAFVLHQLFLNFSIVELFMRPRVTGGGSGQFGIDLFGEGGGFATLLRLPTLIPEALGAVGLVFGVALVVVAFKQPRRLLDPLPLAWILGLLVWNLIFVGNEIQRHFSMIAAVMAVVGIGLLLPRTFIFSRFSYSMGIIAAVVTALYLHSYFVRRFAYVGSSLPMAVSWSDYFCVGNLIRAKYPGLAVVTRTADNFELPITAEFTTAMVWSQVAFVHQRVSEVDAAIFDGINSRDPEHFKRNMLTRPRQTRDGLLRVGFKGLVWGPIEENGWGPKVRQALTSSAGFLGGCGHVALYALSGASVPTRQDAQTLLSEENRFLDRLHDSREQIRP